MNKDLPIISPSSKSKIEDLAKEFALPIGAVLLVLVAIAVFLIPKVGEIFHLQSEIQTQNQEINRLKQKLADLNTLSEAELADSADLVLEALPAEKDIFKTIAMTKRILGENNVTFESFRVFGSLASGSAQIQPETGGLASLGLEVAFASSFESFKGMVKAIEKILPLTQIEGIKFGSLEATASASLFGFSGKMSVISFFSPLPKTLDKVENPLPKISNQDNKLIEELRAFSRYQAGVSLGEPASSVVGKDNPFPL